jgi:hypothetical protein
MPGARGLRAPCISTLVPLSGAGKPTVPATLHMRRLQRCLTAPTIRSTTRADRALRRYSEWLIVLHRHCLAQPPGACAVAHRQAGMSAAVGL